MNLSNTGFILEKNSQDTYSQGKQTRNTIQLLIGIKIGWLRVDNWFWSNIIFCKKNYLAKNQEQGSRAECSRLKYYHPTCTPGWLLLCSVLKCLLFRLIQKFCRCPCRLLILSGNHHVLYMKSNPDHLDYLYSFSNDLVAQDDQTIVHNHAFKKKPLGFKDHRACAIFDHI